MVHAAKRLFWDLGRTRERSGRRTPRSHDRSAVRRAALAAIAAKPCLQILRSSTRRPWPARLGFSHPHAPVLVAPLVGVIRRPRLGVSVTLRGEPRRVYP